MNSTSTAPQGVAALSAVKPTPRPITVTIQEVSNGFVIRREGGEWNILELDRNAVAHTLEDALSIIRKWSSPQTQEAE